MTSLAWDVSAVDRLVPGIKIHLVFVLHLPDAGTGRVVEFARIAVSYVRRAGTSGAPRLHDLCRSSRRSEIILLAIDIVRPGVHVAVALIELVFSTVDIAPVVIHVPVVR